MDRVLDRLWIGSTRDADTALSSLGFSAVIDLRDGRRPVSDDHVRVFKITNRDGDPWTPAQINNALDFAEQHIKRGRVLIMCDAAMSRSVAMTIGYLVRIGYDLPTAYILVKKSRPQMAPKATMLSSVMKALEQ